MSYNPISTSEVATGQPVQSTVGVKLANNLADHEDRIAALEGGASTTYPPLIFRVNGSYDYKGIQTGIAKTTTNFPIQILGVRLIIDTAGSSGTTEIDIYKKNGSSAWASILTTKPSVASSAGSDTASTNGVVNASVATLAAGDLIRLDTTSVQTNGRGFTVRIDYTRA